MVDDGPPHIKASAIRFKLLPDFVRLVTAICHPGEPVSVIQIGAGKTGAGRSDSWRGSNQGEGDGQYDLQRVHWVKFLFHGSGLYWTAL
jgi:hypothetical protein